jgi:IS5 family transposase
MGPKPVEGASDQDLFRTELVNLLDQRHELVKLAALIDWQAFDLPPSSRTSVNESESAQPENGGHEKEQVQRRADHRFPEPSHGRDAGEGSVPTGRLQRGHVLQVAGLGWLERHGIEHILIQPGRPMQSERPAAPS